MIDLLPLPCDQSVERENDVIRISCNKVCQQSLEKLDHSSEQDGMHKTTIQEVKYCEYQIIK